MTTHLTARLAWHDDGWNGRVCGKPACNTYCVGSHSFPGDVIFRERELSTEIKNAGKRVAQLSGADLPPCIYSVNAFGDKSIKGYSNPPDFFRGGATRTEWNIEPATVCVWPYEAMYSDDVYNESGRLDNDRRAANAEEFFKDIEKNKSLIFYYANYSNPFSEEESPRYALIGISRVKEVGPRLSYENVNDYVRQNYAGGMISARSARPKVTEHPLQCSRPRAKLLIESVQSSMNGRSNALPPRPSIRSWLKADGSMTTSHKNVRAES